MRLLTNNLNSPWTRRLAWTGARCAQNPNQNWSRQAGLPAAPQDGNATIFARYVEPAFATQVVLTTQLTRLYERSDWKTRLNKTQNEEPLILARPAVTVREKPLALPAPASSQSSGSILARLSASQPAPTPSSALTTPDAANPEERDETAQRVDDIMDKAAKPFSQRYPNANRAKQKRL